MARTARAAESSASLSSGTPARSPATLSPGTFVAPFSPRRGSGSTMPAGHRRCSHSA